MTETSRSVLVVEDEALLLFTIADELREKGFTVYEASNADAAILLLESHSDIGIMFTDIDMPGSMDGLKLSAAVRDRWPPVKIIVTSGKQNPGTDALPQGGIFMPKPYAPEHVASTMQQAAGVGKNAGGRFWPDQSSTRVNTATFILLRRRKPILSYRAIAASLPA